MFELGVLKVLVFDLVSEFALGVSLKKLRTLLKTQFRYHTEVYCCLGVPRLCANAIHLFNRAVIPSSDTATVRVGAYFETGSLLIDCLLS